MANPRFNSVAGLAPRSSATRRFWRKPHIGTPPPRSCEIRNTSSLGYDGLCLIKFSTPQRRLLGYLLLACLLTQGYELWAIHAAQLDGGSGGTTIGAGVGLLIAGGICLVVGLVLLIASNQEDEGTLEGCWNAVFYLVMATALLAVGGILAIVGLVLFLVREGQANRCLRRKRTTGSSVAGSAAGLRFRGAQKPQSRGANAEAADDQAESGSRGARNRRLSILTRCRPTTPTPLGCRR